MLITTGSKHPHNISHTTKFSQHDKLLSFCFSLHRSKVFYQVAKYPQWQDAINTKIKALELNNTWTFLNLPPSQVPIGRICVYKGKHKVDRS